MEPDPYTAAQSRRYEAAESMLQHARTPRTQQQSLNGFRVIKDYPSESDSPQGLNRTSTVPISPYPDFSMPVQHTHPEQGYKYNHLPDSRYGSLQGSKPAINQNKQPVFPGQQSSHIAVSPSTELDRSSNRDYRVHDSSVTQSSYGSHVEPRSPVSSRGFLSKEPESGKPAMRPLGKKFGKKGVAIKEEDEKPPPWSELKTKAGKDRKRLPLACIACRRKKIRCSGEKPACKHCFRSRTPCVYKVTTRKAAPRTDYMAMLDKRLKRMEERIIKIIPGDEASSVSATGRAHVRPPGPGSGSRAPNAKKRAADEAFGPPHEDWIHSHLSKPSVPNRENEQNQTLAEGSDKLPSREIQEHLAEVYFDCLYGQTYLLLHKPSFMRRLRAGNAPPVLVLAICAIAARFSTHPQLSSEPAFLRGEEWAGPARDIALRCYDQPSISILIVLLILGLHEFGTCQGGRSWMFCGMAMRMAYALQLHRELDHDPLGRKGDADPKLSATDREIRRRTMWACFMMDRFNSSGTERPTCSSEEHIKIQLPNKEFNFHNEIPGATETLDGEKPSSALHDLDQEADPRENMGVASYIVRIIALWGRVIRYLNLGGKESDKRNLWHPESHFSELNQQVKDFKASLPSNLQYGADNLAIYAAEKHANQYLFLHISYYQVVLFLHRYAIPTKPGVNMASEVPGDFLSASAQAALEAADQISSLLGHAMEHSLYAPFAGYCAFTSSTVHIWSRFSKQPRLQASVDQKLKVNIDYIKKMEKYWGMFHYMSESLKEMWMGHQKYASRKSITAGGEMCSSDGSLFQYGDWFKKYPHGVSDTDHDDPAVKVKEEGISEASQKSDLQSVEDFFQRNSHNVSSSLAARPPPIQRKPIRKQTKPSTAIQTPRFTHPPQVLPPDFQPDFPPETPPTPQTLMHMPPPPPPPPPPQTPVQFSPHPPQVLYSSLQPQTYDILGQAPDMALLPNLDRNIVYNDLAGTSGPSISSSSCSAADASMQPMGGGSMAGGDPSSVAGSVWEQAIGDVDAQAQALGAAGMGVYMGDYAQSSAWFMPFNMQPPPTAYLGESEDGYRGYGMGGGGGGGGDGGGGGGGMGGGGEGGQ
ncbi:MAG: hypothetical protein Q9219_003099 [cf. Caloplaca sp. 3 TL-2023]